MRASLERTLTDASSTTGFALQPPVVPDHTLLHPIGSGAYGEVWLARNALGSLRAVKIVHRARFQEDRPYEREFNGILKFEPISRTHEGLVQVLHVGRDDARGCFYYVMELADGTGKVISEPAISKSGPPPPAVTVSLNTDYSPRTLSSDLKLRPRLAPVQAAQLALPLAGALAHLHAHGLVHRDIKPSNVIFVGGQPKLADIGLVTDGGSSQSFVGTEGFIPPEGPGTPQADLYGLGKLLYELATGRDRMDFPQLPPLSSLASSNGESAGARGGDAEALLELNEVMTRACAPEPKQRYASATELQADLNLFLAGRSLRNARNIERALAGLQRFAVAACVGLVVAAGVIWFVKNEARHANERARAETRSREQETALRQRAESAERGTQQQLYTALLDQARATVLSGEMGQRVRALDAIQRAAAISNSAELRREVLAALTRPDWRFERELPYGDNSFTARELDPKFERIALGRGTRAVEVRGVADGALLATLPASTNLAVYVIEWSTDGRFLAVKRDHPSGGMRSEREIWELPPGDEPRLVLLLRGVAFDAVAFHPRRPRLLAASGPTAVLWDLEGGGEAGRVTLTGTPLWLRFASDGERVATLQRTPAGGAVVLHELSGPDTPVLSSEFSAPLTALAWHPGGRWLAVTDRSGHVHALDAQTGEARVLGRHKADAVKVEFSPDGAWLLSGGWEREVICWDARSRQRAFVIRLDTARAQFRADGRAAAALTRTGVRLHAFEQSGGYREFAERLGSRLRQAAFSPDGRWLTASANERTGLWDLTGDGPAALDEKARDAVCFFTADGRELFGSRNTGVVVPEGFRWNISPAERAGEAPRLERLPLRRPGGFTSLSVSANSVVLTGTNGTMVFPPENSGLRLTNWTRTIAGLNRASPDARWLGIFGNYTATLHIHRLPGLEPVARLTQLPATGNIHAFEFSPLGDEVALSSERGVEFWSTADWRRTRVLTNFSRPFLYAPDGRALWLTKGLRAAGLYDARTLEPRLLLPAEMLPLAVSPDGRHLAVSIDGQRLQVWDLAAVREQFRVLGVDWAESQ